MKKNKEELKPKPKRTRSAHKVDCVCGVCNKKRIKAERENNPSVIPDDQITEETPEVPEEAQPIATLDQVLEETGSKQLSEQEIIENYLATLPSDRGIVIFEDAAKIEMRNNFYRLGKKYGIDSETNPKELAMKIINQVIIQYTKSL